jgi:hypothetical protein
MRRSRATVRSGRTARALLRWAIHWEPFDRKLRTSTRGARHAPTRPPRHSASPDTLYYRDPTTATILAQRRRHNGYYPVVEVAEILFKGFQGRSTTFIFSPMRARSVQHWGPGSWPAAPFPRSRCSVCAAMMKGENALTLRSMCQRKERVSRVRGEKEYKWAEQPRRKGGLRTMGNEGRWAETLSFQPNRLHSHFLFILHFPFSIFNLKNSNQFQNLALNFIFPISII